MCSCFFPLTVSLWVNPLATTEDPVFLPLVTRGSPALVTDSFNPFLYSACEFRCSFHSEGLFHSCSNKTIWLVVAGSPSFPVLLGQIEIPNCLISSSSNNLISGGSNNYSPCHDFLKRRNSSRGVRRTTTTKLFEGHHRASFTDEVSENSWTPLSGLVSSRAETTNFSNREGCHASSNVSSPVAMFHEVLFDSEFATNNINKWENLDSLSGTNHSSTSPEKPLNNWRSDFFDPTRYSPITLQEPQSSLSLSSDSVATVVSPGRILDTTARYSNSNSKKQQFRDILNRGNTKTKVDLPKLNLKAVRQMNQSPSPASNNPSDDQSDTDLNCPLFKPDESTKITEEDRAAIRKGVHRSNSRSRSSRTSLTDTTKTIWNGMTMQESSRKIQDLIKEVQYQKRSNSSRNDECRSDGESSLGCVMTENKVIYVPPAVDTSSDKARLVPVPSNLPDSSEYMYHGQPVEVVSPHLFAQAAGNSEASPFNNNALNKAVGFYDQSRSLFFRPQIVLPTIRDALLPSSNTNFKLVGATRQSNIVAQSGNAFNFGFDWRLKSEDLSGNSSTQVPSEKILGSQKCDEVQGAIINTPADTINFVNDNPTTTLSEADHYQPAQEDLSVPPNSSGPSGKVFDGSEEDSSCLKDHETMVEKAPSSRSFTNALQHKRIGEISSAGVGSPRRATSATEFLEDRPDDKKEVLLSSDHLIKVTARSPDNRLEGALKKEALLSSDHLIKATARSSDNRLEDALKEKTERSFSRSDGSVARSGLEHSGSQKSSFQNDSGSPQVDCCDSFIPLHTLLSSPLRPPMLLSTPSLKETEVKFSSGLRMGSEKNNILPTSAAPCNFPTPNLRNYHTSNSRDNSNRNFLNVLTHTTESSKTNNIIDLDEVQDSSTFHKNESESRRTPRVLRSRRLSPSVGTLNQFDRECTSSSSDTESSDTSSESEMFLVTTRLEFSASEQGQLPRANKIVIQIEKGNQHGVLLDHKFAFPIPMLQTPEIGFRMPYSICVAVVVEKATKLIDVIPKGAKTGSKGIVIFSISNIAFLSGSLY